jgi:hypothetical protein
MQRGQAFRWLRSGRIWPQDLKRWRHGELIDALHRKIADIEQMDKRLRQSSGCAKARDSLTP